MADQQASVIQNKKLLVVALVLAGLVVVLFNFGVSWARRSSEGRTIELAAFKRRMRQGDRIRDGDLKPVQFPEKYYEQGLPDVVKWDQIASAKGRTLTREVQDSEFLRFGHFVRDDRALPAWAISGREMTTWDFRVNRQEIPGNFLVPGTLVNVVGVFDIDGERRAHVVVEKVRVLAVGGAWEGPEEGLSSGRRLGSAGPRSYGSVTVEVEPDVALRLENLKTHVVDRVFSVQVLRPDVAPAERHRINERLEKLAASARTGGPRPEP